MTHEDKLGMGGRTEYQLMPPPHRVRLDRR